MISRRSFVATAAAAGLAVPMAQASKVLVSPGQAPAAPQIKAKVAAKAAPEQWQVAYQAPPAVEPFAVDMNEWKRLPSTYQRAMVDYKGDAPVGSIVVNATSKHLFLITSPGKALRYGVSVGKESKAWTGFATVARMSVWPVWMPAPYHLSVRPDLAKWLNGGMPGGPENPLGARALYLYQGNKDTLNRIHGAAQFDWIGDRKTAGCISMLNCDVIDLYNRVRPNTRVSVENKWWPFG